MAWRGVGDSLVFTTKLSKDFWVNVALNLKTDLDLEGESEHIVKI